MDNKKAIRNLIIYLGIPIAVIIVMIIVSFFKDAKKML